MGYLEAAKAVFVGAKWVILIGFIISLFVITYNKGAQNERKIWAEAIVKKELIAKQELEEMNKQTDETTMQLQNKAQNLEVLANEQQSKINNLNNDLVNAKRSGLQRRSVCVSNNRPETDQNNGPGSVIDSAANASELSGEFERFLISDALRADTVGLYADEAYSWIQELCNMKELKGVVLCNGPN
jgi:hypothetical protein